MVVYNRTREKTKRLAEKYPDRVILAESPREVAHRAQYILSMVADDQAIQAIAGDDEENQGLLSALGAQHIWVDSGTISPKISQNLSRRTLERGAVRLEAPVSGSVDAAREGRLLMFVGGPKEALDRVRPMLEPLVSRVEWVGDVGQAMALKLGINLNLALQVEGFLEGMMLAESTGLPQEKVVQYMLESAIASPSLKYRVPLAFDPPSQPWFTMDLMLKDLRLALDHAGNHVLSMPLTSLTTELVRLAVRNGHGEEDFSGLIRYMGAIQPSPSNHSPQMS